VSAGANEGGLVDVQHRHAPRFEPRAQAPAPVGGRERRAGEGAAGVDAGVERGLDGAHPFGDEQAEPLAGAAAAQVAGEREEAHVSGARRRAERVLPFSAVPHSAVPALLRLFASVALPAVRPDRPPQLTAHAWSLS
jgi:hypothetical protein